MQVARSKIKIPKRRRRVWQCRFKEAYLKVCNNPWEKKLIVLLIYSTRERWRLVSTVPKYVVDRDMVKIIWLD